MADKEVDSDGPSSYLNTVRMMKTLFVILSILPIVCIESVFPNTTTTLFPCYQDFCNYEKYCDEVSKRCERCSNRFSKCLTPEQHPQCTMFCMMNKPCPPITGLDNGTVNGTDRNYLQGETLSFQCNEGYHNVGMDQTICMEYGVWSHQRPGQRPPYCEVITCPIPTLPKHGTIKFTSDVKGRLVEVQYGCEEGYVLSRGNVTRLCMSDGTWSGNTPTCAQKQCPPPDPIDYGTFNCTNRDYMQGETLSFQCNESYHNIGMDQTLCMQNGVWSHQQPGRKAPSCEVNTCKIPSSPQNGGVIMTGEPELLIPGSEVSFTCSQGYSLDTNSTLLCLQNGSWSGVIPRCKEYKDIWKVLTFVFIAVTVVLLVLLIPLCIHWLHARKGPESPYKNIPHKKLKDDMDKADNISLDDPSTVIDTKTDKSMKEARRLNAISPRTDSEIETEKTQNSSVDGGTPNGMPTADSRNPLIHNEYHIYGHNNSLTSTNKNDHSVHIPKNITNYHNTGNKKEEVSPRLSPTVLTVEAVLETGGDRVETDIDQDQDNEMRAGKCFESSDDENIHAQEECSKF